jgi:heat shock protein HtpX
MANLIKTGFLLIVLTCLLVLAGGALGGRQGMAIAFVLALIMNVGSYWFSDKIVLSMYGAQPVEEAQAPGLYRIVRELAAKAQIPVPPIYLIHDDSPNAFATGRNPSHAAVAVTEGILRIMTEEELKGVLAHELSHVKNRDTLTMTIAATLAGAITFLAQMAQWGAMFGGGRRDNESGGGGGGLGVIGVLVMAILAPFAAMLIQMAISRSREYEADASGARLCGKPSALAQALQKLDRAARQDPLPATPATAHLFIVNPLTSGGLASLFSTHPPIEERIARLQAMKL